MYKDAYWRLVYPELRAPASTLTADDHAAAIAAAERRFGEELRSMKLPGPGLGAYHLYLQDGEAFLSIDDHRVIDRWRPRERLMPLLFDLHAHLMAGQGGERVVGVLGLFGAVMVLTGVYLWWPARRRFSARALLPTAWAHRTLLSSHRDLGLLAAPLLLVLLLTGSGMVFYGATGTLLNGLLSRRPPVAEGPPTMAAVGAVAAGREAGAGGSGAGPARDDVRLAATAGSPTATAERLAATAEPPAAGVGTATAGLLRRAMEAFPDGRVVFYYPPDEAGVRGFRIKQPCETHPNGRSYLYAAGDGQVLRTVSACEQPAGQRALYAVYPLHAGKLDSGIYRLLVFLGGVVLTVVSATGAAAYIAKLTGRR